MNFKFNKYYLDEGKFITCSSSAEGVVIRIGMPARKIVYGTDGEFTKERIGFFSQEIPFMSGVLRSYGYDVVTN